MSLILTSPVFTNSGTIPKLYTCDGDDISPALQWSGAPKAAQSFVLIIDDPDAPDPKAPQQTWVHWLVFNIAATTNALADDASKRGLPRGAQQGLNDWKRATYGGPCPPIGRHRYFHKLYALDTMLADLREPTKAQLLRAMKGHILAEAQMVGMYQATH